MGFISGLLDLVFPPRCAFCRGILKGGESGACAACDKDIAYTGTHAESKGDFFTVCVSPLYYENGVRESIIRFKFKEATAYASVYGKYLAACIGARLEGRYDLITWVPLSDKRLKKRGYDQAMLLAMATALKLEDVAVETLKKEHDVPAQSGMGGAALRQANISGAYVVPDHELVDGKRILLIDDIMTTGATLSECSRMLLMAGAEEVLCATLAITRK